jgi:hypothetical protein
MRHGAKCVGVDPWNEIEHVWGINGTETSYTNKGLREIRKLARRLQIALFIAPHPTKTGGLKSNTEDMSLYDISGSTAWKHTPDLGIILVRQTPTATETQFMIDKSRTYKTMGIPGIVTLFRNVRHSSSSAAAHRRAEVMMTDQKWFDELVQLAEREYDGHLTIILATNWRVGFGTVNSRCKVRASPRPLSRR